MYSAYSMPTSHSMVRPNGLVHLLAARTAREKDLLLVPTATFYHKSLLPICRPIGVNVLLTCPPH